MRFLILLLFSFFAFSASAQQIDSLAIDCQLDGQTPGKAKLVGSYGDQNFIVDSSMVEANGKLSLRRNRLLPSGMYYWLLPGNKSFSFLVDKDDQHFTLRGNAADFTNTIRVNGSVNTDLLYQNFRFQAQQDAELRQVGETLNKTLPNTPEYAKAKARQTQLLNDRKVHLEGLYREHPNTFFQKFKTAGANPDWVEYKKPNGDTDTLRQLLHFRDHFWDGVDFSDERLLHTPVIFNKLRRYMTELTPQHPDSLVKVADALIRKVTPYKPYFKFFANWIALTYENGKTKVMDGEAVYVHIIKTFITPELAYWSTPKEIEDLRQHAWEMEASLMGRKGPDVQAPDVNGQVKRLYDLKSPLIVVFMYSPDCEHCQKDSPEINRISKKWKPLGVEFFGIGVNTTEEEWKAFVKKNGFEFTNVFDPTNRAIYAKYFVDITPELYILNPERIIVAKNLKAEQLETVFEQQFKKLKK